MLILQLPFPSHLSRALARLSWVLFWCHSFVRSALCSFSLPYHLCVCPVYCLVYLESLNLQGFCWPDITVALEQQLFFCGHNPLLSFLMAVLSACCSHTPKRQCMCLTKRACVISFCIMSEFADSLSYIFNTWQPFLTR